MQETYEKLKCRLEEISRLSGAMGVLHWDQEVIMPEGATEARAYQMAALAGVLHEKVTDPELGQLTERLSQTDKGQWKASQWCNIAEAKRDYDRETRVPKELVQEISELGARGHSIWAKARKDNRFEDFAPVIRRFVELKKQWANHVDPDQAPYDVNIDTYERGATMAWLDPVFEGLKTGLRPLIQKIQSATAKPDTSFLEGDFPVKDQEALGRQISKDMGFQFDRGRMDVSVHPFCGGGHPTDVRITTRYRTDDFVESLYAVIHETGHGLYEQGRNLEEGDLPSGESMTMGIHESQSLFWERMIAQSRSFCSHYFPLIQKTFPQSLADVSAERFYAAVNVCKPSFIRVEADEVTYPMHVILRYEIEKGLFDGSIPVEKLPETWNDKMEEYLGIRPPTDTLGVLQDVHWSGGSFGYFPSYSLGAMYACQFFEALKRDLPNVNQNIEQGSFEPIRQWLNKNIHSQGRLYSTEELVRRVTGGDLDVENFLNYLNNKYADLYSLTD